MCRNLVAGWILGIHVNCDVRVQISLLVNTNILLSYTIDLENIVKLYNWFRYIIIYIVLNIKKKNINFIIDNISFLASLAKLVKLLPSKQVIIGSSPIRCF